MSYHYPEHVGIIVPPARSKSERIADLVSRYPGVTDAEAKEILTFMRTGRHLEVGLLTSDDRLRPRLDAFMEDHKAQLQVRWWEAAALAGGLAALLALLWAAGEAFG